MKKLIIGLLVAMVLTLALAGSAFAQALPGQPACDNAIPPTGAAGVTLPFNTCFGLPELP